MAASAAVVAMRAFSPLFRKPQPRPPSRALEETSNTMPEELLELERFELHEPPAYFFRVTRREFIEAIGAGLCFVALQSTADAQESGAKLDARLHVGEDGSITILTGKIEEGQGPRTELALAAAEELKLPIERIKMVMADTDIVPNDGTTAGSRT